MLNLLVAVANILAVKEGTSFGMSCQLACLVSPTALLASCLVGFLPCWIAALLDCCLVGLLPCLCLLLAFLFCSCELILP
jgi:hypothetical protein